jgi:hypothetical protein
MYKITRCWITFLQPARRAAALASSLAFFKTLIALEFKGFLSLTKIFLDSHQNFRNVCKKLDFSPTYVLQYYFSKSVHGYLTTQCVK